MAVRTVFMTSEGVGFYEWKDIEFTYCSGFSIQQKQKSIANLHKSFLQQFPDGSVLEISSKSTEELGRKLSAFNLKIILENGKKTTVESAFQSGKVFENGGPYTDLLFASPRDAKKDERIRNSGRVIGFCLDGKEFPITPSTLYYNWLYSKALSQNVDLATQLMAYSAFTDIEFNPQKSINCQAMACAIFVSLSRADALKQALESPEMFCQIVYGKLMV